MEQGAWRKDRGYGIKHQSTLESEQSFKSNVRLLNFSVLGIILSTINCWGFGRLLGNRAQVSKWAVDYVTKVRTTAGVASVVMASVTAGVSVVS